MDGVQEHKSSYFQRGKVMNLYKGDFNYYGECFSFYTRATGEYASFRNFCYRIAMIVEKDLLAVMHYFKSNERDGYKITEVKSEKVQN